MGWFGKLTFGSLGILVGGPLGAIAGAALGHALVDKKADFARQTTRSIPQPEIAYAEKTQAAFFISLFSILGKLSKIDGVVTRDEIAVAQDFINGLPIDETEKQFARQVFNQAKNSSYQIDDFAIQLYQIVKTQPTLLVSYFDLLFRIVAADGTFHPAEEAALKRVKEVFNISDKQYEDLKAIYFKDFDKYYKNAINIITQLANFITYLRKTIVKNRIKKIKTIFLIFPNLFNLSKFSKSLK